jgi:uncharacterized coiled-coil DUF342 family protein
MTLCRRCSALERKRTINSVSLAEERQILKEIAGIKRNKTHVDEYFSLEKQVQDLKVGHAHRVCPKIVKTKLHYLVAN